MNKIGLFLRNIKQGFATNSSSYHSTLIMNEEEYQKWVAGEIEVNGWSFEEYEETEYEVDYDKKEIDGVRVYVICIYGDNY